MFSLRALRASRSSCMSTAPRNRSTLLAQWTTFPREHWTRSTRAHSWSEHEHALRPPLLGGAAGRAPLRDRSFRTRDFRTSLDRSATLYPTSFTQPLEIDHASLWIHCSVNLGIPLLPPTNTPHPSRTRQGTPWRLGQLLLYIRRVYYENLFLGQLTPHTHTKHTKPKSVPSLIRSSSVFTLLCFCTTGYSPTFPFR